VTGTGRKKRVTTMGKDCDTGRMLELARVAVKIVAAARVSTGSARHPGRGARSGGVAAGGCGWVFSATRSGHAPAACLSGNHGGRAA